MLKKIICKIIGHSWVYYTRADKITEMAVCNRCGQIEQKGMIK